MKVKASHMSDHASYPGAPRWVKVAVVIIILVILLVVVALVTGLGGEHGPRRHLPSSVADGGVHLTAG